MGRHEGRRADAAPGPGAGGHPAAGTAPVPTEAAMPLNGEPTGESAATGAAWLHAPAPTAHAVLTLAYELCDAFARAEVARAMVGLSTNEAEHAHLVARAEQWKAVAGERWAALAAAIETGLPEAAQVQRFMPVRPLTNGHVELHAHDTKARPLVVLLTGTQALAVGAHLTAYGAISLDRIGQKLDSGLPLVKAAPPFTSTAPAADRPTGPAADHADPPATRP
jgi:hypothetical protein